MHTGKMSKVIAESNSSLESQSQIHGHIHRMLQMEDSNIRRFDCNFSFDSQEWSCSEDAPYRVEMILCINLCEIDSVVSLEVLNSSLIVARSPNSARALTRVDDRRVWMTGGCG